MAAPILDSSLRDATLRKRARDALAKGRLPAGTVGQSLPRLRFDRVAQRVVRDLQAMLRGATPNGAALIITVTAPIRLPAKTVAEVGRALSAHVARDFDRVICGNRVRARIVKSRVPKTPKVIVFIHNPDPAPSGLFKVTRALLSQAPARSRTRSAR